MIGITLMSRHATAGAIVLGLALASAGTVPDFAAGGDGGGGGGSSGGTVQCKERMVYNEAKKVCEQASLLEDKDLIKQGRALALAGYYENALDALMAVRDKDDATALTYIGYAKRKMGDVDEGIGDACRGLDVVEVLARNAANRPTAAASFRGGLLVAVAEKDVGAEITTPAVRNPRSRPTFVA